MFTVRPFSHRTKNCIGLTIEKDLSVIPIDQVLLGQQLSRTHFYRYIPNTTESLKANFQIGLDNELELCEPSEISHYEIKFGSTSRHSSADRLYTVIAAKRVRPSNIVANGEHATTHIAPARVGHIQLGIGDIVFLTYRPKPAEIVETSQLRIRKMFSASPKDFSNSSNPRERSALLEN